MSDEEHHAKEVQAAEPSADTHSPDLASLPTQPAGSLTNDLSADTDDVAALKQRLGRARERLSFYESFDRIIQENIRRSSELMIEATELHERAERAIAAQAQAQSVLEQQRVADRAHYAALLGDLRAELDHTRASLERITAHVTTALDALGDEPGPDRATSQTGHEAPAIAPQTATSPTLTEGAGSPVAATPEVAATPANGVQTAGATSTPMATSVVAATDVATQPAAPPAPHLVDVLVHGVPTARVAISLQNHLRGLDQISSVEAREFVEGLLRLQVTTTAPLDAADLAGWSDGAGAETVRVRSDLLELSLPGTTER